MVSRETSKKRTEILGGIKDSWAVALGLVPLGLAFGLVVGQSGFAWWWAPIFSIIIYAGSMEFLALNLILTGVGPISAAITGFMVNFRHIFYGLTYPRHAVRSRIGRAYSTYALTDESYAIVSARPNAQRIDGSRVLAIQVFCHAMWVSSGILGAVAGSAIPQGLKGMEFALTALFIVLAWESFRNNQDWSLIFFAVAFSLIGLGLVPQQMLIFALVVYFLLLLVRNASPRIDTRLTWKIGDRR
ncbi:AzlC family ABC transporter permease [Corynebacterium diphtheriae]|uniref:AzlC family ABC transporter permease n=1 Tax=Corynebacterium diphtheriae TaxID=1717 RepID=UPI000869E1DF|nr:AzlC family ABC transporter permease [Corynebacterium diphtheriae]MBG9336096.1 AzlC family ABC transporter permease [Corynebacterium diphtheriae bv. gravis]ODS16467.1 branched-chain amino acid ABC transporter permease [Corynebacterium diphtheriae]ONF65118.1 branched-chain amino acid ABC transporter permease [Corynebacterium diphtheriae]RLP13183.1 branched-chain amino acid ABC transporter permease [Corynebacterium diphtheriae]UJM21820.1 AzlC family ABC transporter permease [Corynebacterium d